MGDDEELTVYRDPIVAQAVMKSVANRLKSALKEAAIEADGGHYWGLDFHKSSDEWTEAAAYRLLRDKIASLVISLVTDKG